jgi:hypothetical protein
VLVPLPRVAPGLDPFDDGPGELLTALPTPIVEQVEINGTLYADVTSRMA